LRAEIPGARKHSEHSDSIPGWSSRAALARHERFLGRTSESRITAQRIGSHLQAWQFPVALNALFAEQREGDAARKGAGRLAVKRCGTALSRASLGRGQRPAARRSQARVSHCDLRARAKRRVSLGVMST